MEMTILKKILVQELDLTPTSHDINFVKHLVSMQPTGVNDISKHRGLILK